MLEDDLGLDLRVAQTAGDILVGAAVLTSDQSDDAGGMRQGPLSLVVEPALRLCAGLESRQGLASGCALLQRHLLGDESDLAPPGKFDVALHSDLLTILDAKGKGTRETTKDSTGEGIATVAEAKVGVPPLGAVDVPGNAPHADDLAAHPVLDSGLETGVDGSDSGRASRLVGSGWLGHPYLPFYGACPARRTQWR
jgi:hypothetical protein